MSKIKLNPLTKFFWTKMKALSTLIIFNGIVLIFILNLRKTQKFGMTSILEEKCFLSVICGKHMKTGMVKGHE